MKGGQAPSCAFTPAVIVVDMLEDNLKSGKHAMIEAVGMALVPPLAAFLDRCRERGVRIVYACDSFLPDDPLFRSRLEPHAIRGTPGAEVVAELAPKPGDLVLPKRRFSAFFKTDLDLTLRAWGVDTVAVCGITTQVCVLITAMDAVSNDFSAVILSDLSASHKPEVHEDCLRIHGRGALTPLLRVENSEEFLRSF